MKQRRRNYRSPSNPTTLIRHGSIRRLLRLVMEGLTVAEVGRALGMSRQLALYHVKKLAAAGGVVMVLEPCAENGGLRYRVWDELALAAHYATKLRQTPREEFLRAA